MPKPPSLTLLRTLSRMADEGRSLRFQYYEHRASDGSVVLRPRDTSGLEWEAGEGEHGARRVEGIVASVVSRALDDGHLVYDRKVVGAWPDGRDILDAYADARPAPAGLALLEEHRWRLATNANPGYVVLKRRSWDPPHVPPGPVLRIERKTDNRYYVDPTDLGPRSDGGRCGDIRIKGHGEGRVWVAADEVHAVVEDPELHLSVSDLPTEHMNAVAAAYAKEAEEIDALPEVAAIKERWQAERERLGREFVDRMKAVGG